MIKPQLCDSSLLCACKCTHTCYKCCVFAHHFLLTIRRKRLYKATALKMTSGIVPICFLFYKTLIYKTLLFAKQMFDIPKGTLPPSLQYRSVKAYSKHMPFLHKAMQALQDQIRSNPLCTNPITSNTCLARDNLFSIALKLHHNLALVTF